MDIIDSIKKDKAYLKCKLTVKNWEKDFKFKYSRTPSKFDIKEAPANIKYAYKKYFQLKSTILEKSLSICDIEDEPLKSPEYTQQLENINLDSPNLQSDIILPELPSGQEIHKLLINAKTENSIKKSSPFVENLSKKLFQHRKFSLRNPRKLSLPKSQLAANDLIDDAMPTCSSGTIFNCEPNVFVNEELIIPISITNHQSISDMNCSISQSFHSGENILPVRQLNEAWLKRAVEDNHANIIESKTTDITTKFGLSNIVVPNVTEKLPDYVENSESEGDDSEFKKLKPALKKRKVDENINVSTSIHRTSEYKPINITSPVQAQPIIRKRTRKAQCVIKNKSQIQPETSTESIAHPPDISEYVPFGLGEELNPRHSNVTDILNAVDIKNDTLKQNIDIGSENKLKDKIKNGTLNENFVKINLEKKVFVRGKKNHNYSKYKKQQWKDKKALHAGMEFPEKGKISCFKCGMSGHMARYCTAHRGDTLLALESYDENDLPTLEDMEKFVDQETNTLSNEKVLHLSVNTSSKIPESFLKMLADNSNSCDLNLKPIYDCPPEGIPVDLTEALKKFGHKSFRLGQEMAIKRILCGMSTLLILSTGGGKSLCYQLPAYIYSQNYKCITLVISPLVSLMEDQVLSMPEFLKAGCLHTNQPPTHRRKILQCLKDGAINILLISPEALISGDTANGFSGLFKQLPQIAFACIDEAHCVSQWSHNFRPSYLMICRVLREKLNVKCILGLTATASQPTISSVISHINIPDGFSGVITNPTLPDNLCLSVSFEIDKDRALVTYLTSDRLISYNSIIVYCIRRDECERVAAILRSCLQEPNKINMEKPNNKRKRMSYIAEAYHAGMSAAQRKKIQKHFMDGTLRIIVATVAFGMGINKSDIRCIIHYNMPSSFESYVQEVGRAGRDGESAFCHVFMNNSNNDRNELLKHIHANTIDRPTIRRLLQNVFIPCECSNSGASVSNNASENTSRCKGHEVGIPIDITVEKLDLPSENIATLLCYVELHSKHYIKVLNNAYTMCKISSYGGPKKILEAAKTCAPLAMAYLLESKKDPNVVNKNILEFNVIEVASAIGWESGITKYHLKNLEWVTEGSSSRKSQLKVEFNTLGFRIKAPGDLTEVELDSILDDLHNIVLSQEKAKLYQLEEINVAFSKLGNYSLDKHNLRDDILVKKSNQLKSTIRKYFEREENFPSDITLEQRPLDVERVTSDIRALITSYRDCEFNGRSIARILQGISSPNYPAIVWGRCKFWRSHIHEDFYGILKVATQQIIQMKMS